MILTRRLGMVLNSYARWIATAVGVACIFAIPARAQQASAPQFEVAAEYSYIRANAANNGGGFNLNGGSASLAYNFTDHFSAVGDVGGYQFSGLPTGLDSTMYTYLFGPRYTFHKVSRFSPFAQVLLGVGRVNASSGGISGGENGFAMAMGGGVDLPLHNRISIRLIQAEYLFTRLDRVTGASATQNDARISAGIVIRFGSR
jgi:hypothetical protein